MLLFIKLMYKYFWLILGCLKENDLRLLLERFSRCNEGK